MKKLLLFFILFSTSILSAQFTQPSQFNNVCDDNGDGLTSFYLGEITFEIIGNLNYQDYTITHHETQTDAQTGASPLSGTYFNTTPFTQTIYARIVTIANGQVTVFPYTLNANAAPVGGLVQMMNVCINDGTNGCVNLTDILPAIVEGQAGLNVTFFEVLMEAQYNLNPIANPSCYISPLVGAQTLYFRLENMVTGCFSIGTVNITFIDCSPCPAPAQLFVSQVSADHAFVDWQPNSAASSWTISLQDSMGGVQNINTSVSFYLFDNLSCNTEYSVTVTANCAGGLTSGPAGPIYFMTTSCVPNAGQPTSLFLCSDTGSACFDLTANTPLILNGLNPSGYSVTYHMSLSDANAGIQAITNPGNYCVSNDSVVYSRLENNATNQFQIMAFEVMIDTVSNNTIALASMDQCDDNNDSVIIFNLTNVQSQINSGNTLAYYTSLPSATNQVAQITNPTAFVVGVGVPVTTIFVRENVVNGCDNIYSLLLRTYSICNLAVTCPNANSLCNALGVPFANTNQAASAESGNYYGCLNSQPNPTWFYLPVSGNGTINLKIEQNASINFNSTPLDVDYIAYGPFTNPVTPCSGLLTQANMVSCSYSSNAVEYPVIANAQVGQFYIIMVTNYANQAGFIKITELPTTVGAINCNGLRLNAFLDSNANGTQDSGEQNFPLGQFTYEANNNGNIHNIISPSGVYNIYDPNVTNSYDLTFAIDSNYTSQYSLSTAAYTNVNPGSGMTVYNFPVNVVQSYFDLAVNITPLSAPRPGFTYQNIITYTNHGNQTVASGTVNFNKDALVTITNNTQAGTTPTAGGFTFNFTNLLPFETRSMTVTMQVPTIPAVALNDLLTNIASITPTAGDVVVSNNTSSNTQIIIGSYDPNDKMESHGEKILHSTFTSNDYLYYTIRFENTGTASAVNVRINDVLDAKLDESSIRMVSASHPYILDRLDNTLNWKFENIQLPPSVANTNTGKGYVMFRVKPKPGYAVGDIIPNTASIFFDFNPAIITNTFNTEFVQQLGITEFESADFAFYPNPASTDVTITLKNTGAIAKIEVYDIAGKLILSQKPNTLLTTQTVNLSNISKGIYLLEVTTDTNSKAIKKLLVE